MDENDLRAQLHVLLDGETLPAKLPPLVGRGPSRRPGRRRALFGAIVLVAVAAIVGLALDRGSSRPRVRVESPTGATAKTATTSSSTAAPRSAAANVGYIKQLVAEQILAHSDAVTGVRADSDVIVISTTLTDITSAEEIWEGLRVHAGCDDSFLLIAGYRVLLKDGTAVEQPRPGFRQCAADVGSQSTPTTSKQTPYLPCAASQLSATFGFLNNAQYSLGEILFTNTSPTPCTLSGRPIVGLVANDQTPLPVQRRAGAGNTPPPTSIRPIVLSAHGQQPQAAVPIDWRNWCGRSPGPLAVDVRFATLGWETFDVATPTAGADPHTTPPCLESTKVSTLGVSVVLAANH